MTFKISRSKRPAYFFVLRYLFLQLITELQKNCEILEILGTPYRIRREFWGHHTELFTLLPNN